MFKVYNSLSLALHDFDQRSEFSNMPVDVFNLSYNNNGIVQTSTGIFRKVNKQTCLMMIDKEFFSFSKLEHEYEVCIITIDSNLTTTVYSAPFVTSKEKELHKRLLHTIENGKKQSENMDSSMFAFYFNYDEKLINRIKLLSKG